MQKRKRPVEAKEVVEVGQRIYTEVQGKFNFRYEIVVEVKSTVRVRQGIIVKQASTVIKPNRNTEHSGKIEQLTDLLHPLGILRWPFVVILISGISSANIVCGFL